MFLALLKILTLMSVMLLVARYRIKKKTRKIKIPKNHNDTSEARYAINENGFLEEIHHDKYSRQA